MSVQKYVWLLISLLGLAAFAVLVVVLAWPWLLAENYRLPRWELVLTWMAEAAAVLWFLYFFVRFAIEGELEAAYIGRLSHELLTQILTAIVALAGVIDLTSTFLLHDREDHLRKEAVTGTLRIERTKVYYIKYGQYFHAFAWGSIIDQEGRSHTAYVYGPWKRFPRPLREPILRDRLPAEAPVLYDPNFPRRYWLSRSGSDEWSGWRLSEGITAFALVLTLLALMSRQFLLFITLPLEICPLLGATLRLALAALHMWARGQTELPPF